MFRDLLTFVENRDTCVTQIYIKAKIFIVIKKTTTTKQQQQKQTGKMVRQVKELTTKPN